MHVALHLGQGLVLLEGEHRLEQRVEGGGEEVGVEPVLDGEPVGVLLPGHEEPENGALPLLVDAHPVGVPPPAALVDDAAGVDVGVVLVDGAELVQDGVGRRHLQGGDLAHDVPEALEVLAHLPAAAGDEAPLGVPGAVEGAAGDVELLEDGDVGPGHAPVADEEGGRQQGADARADEVGAALGHVGRRGGVVVGVQAQVVVDEGVAVGRDGAGPLAVAFGAGHGLSFGSSRWAVSVNAGAAAVGRCGRPDSRPAGAGSVEGRRPARRARGPAAPLTTAGSGRARRAPPPAGARSARGPTGPARRPVRAPATRARG